MNFLYRKIANYVNKARQNFSTTIHFILQLNTILLQWRPNDV